MLEIDQISKKVGLTDATHQTNWNIKTAHQQRSELESSRTLVQNGLQLKIIVWYSLVGFERCLILRHTLMPFSPEHVLFCLSLSDAQSRGLRWASEQLMGKMRTTSAPCEDPKWNPPKVTDANLWPLQIWMKDESALVRSKSHHLGPSYRRNDVKMCLLWSCRNGNTSTEDIENRLEKASSSFESHIRC